MKDQTLDEATAEARQRLVEIMREVKRRSPLTARVIFIVAKAEALFSRARLSPLAAWQSWFREAGADWEAVDDIEAELRRDDD